VTTPTAIPTVKDMVDNIGLIKPNQWTIDVPTVLPIPISGYLLKVSIIIYSFSVRQKWDKIPLLLVF
tara:strand:+ start:1484 stop:1684 length:201 start_codon:yes stop_codon:yes gene_type:complete